MSKTTQKPKKPRPDFPLFAHQNGQWCKKIRGKQFYFGQWNDPQAALQEYLRIKDDLQAGRIPTPAAGVVTLADISNAYLARSEERRDGGEISSRTFDDYHDACKLIVAHLGRTVDPEQLRPVDFAGFRTEVSRYSPSRMTKIVGITRMLMKWAFDSELIDRMPRFGPDFRGASKRKARQQKAAAGTKLFSPDDLRALMDATDTVMRSMMLLGINGGMGNTDVASLPLSAVDLESGWIDFPRPKTGVARRFPLWPETIAATREAIEKRPEPSSDELAGLVFLTHWGNSWVPEGRRDNQVSAKFRKLLRSCKAEQGGFYWLRHTFQTIADESGDPIATAHVMGHADGTMGGVYRERISDERLRKVTDHVRQWLFEEDAQPTTRQTGRPGLRIVG